MESLLSSKSEDIFFDGFWYLDSEFLKARDHNAAVQAAEIAVRFRRDQMTLSTLSGRLYFAGRKAEAKEVMAAAVETAFRENSWFTYASLAQIRHHLWDDEGEEARASFARLVEKLKASKEPPEDPLETDVIPAVRACGTPEDLITAYEEYAARQRELSGSNSF